MKNKTNQPWASGPGELLRHGLSLLQKDNDSNRRIAMICIDNSIELMIKTFLGLPERITGIKLARKDYSEISENFPKLLDGLEKYATDKIKGIDLGEIEWFHRLRNELYHQGNGLTVERTNAEVYAEIANLLFLNLFGFKLIGDKEDKTYLLGKFMNSWIQFERITKNMSFVLDDNEKIRMPLNAIKYLHKNKIISDIELHQIDLIRKTRNEIVHGLQNHEEVINEQIIKNLNELTKKIENKTLL